METLGTDFNSTGSVLSRSQLEELRKRRGECLTCGRKCFQKKLFKLVPITEEGFVLEGRCLKCRPLHPPQFGLTSPIPSMRGKVRPTTEDRERFNMTQNNLSNRSVAHSHASSPSPNPSGRAHMARTVSDLARSENSPQSTVPSPRQHFRRAVSALPSTSSSAPPRVPSSSSQTLASTEERSESFTMNPTQGQAQTTQPPPESAYQVPAEVVENAAVAERQPSDKPLVSTSTPMDTTETKTNGNKTLFKSLSTRLTGSPKKNSDAGTFRSTQRKSLSAQLPTKEEVEQAHLTILAAQQHGILSLPNQLGHSGSRTDMNTPQGSSSSLRHVVSPNSISQSSPEMIDGYPVPQHGVLNRGGMIQTVPTRNGSGQKYGSNKSNHSHPSASSGDDNLHRSNSSRQASTMPQSLDTYHVPHLPDHSQLSMPKPTEEESWHNLERAGQNIDLVIQIMREHPTSDRIATTALERLASWKLSPDDQNHLASIGAPNVIGDMMDLHQNTLSIQLAAIGALWNMSGTTQNQVAMTNSRALDLIMSAMDRFVDRTELQENAIAIISNLGAVSENLDTLCEKGALGKIVDTMSKFSEVSNVQVKGCSAVSNLAAHDGPIKKRMMECGAGGAVVVAMVMHPNDTYLIEKALRAIRNLCSNSDENKVEIANIGGIDSVITAMQVHRDVAAIQKEAAWTLSNLATNQTNREVIGECGGVDVVIRAIWVHADSVELLEWCCRALFTLTLAEQNCQIVLEVGGISAIVNTMQGHVDSATVQEMGCAVLGNLAGNDHSRSRIVEEEALDAIVLAMVLHANESQVQERACTVLKRLAVPANHYAMIAANIPELVRQAASKFPDRCNEPATHVLNTLSEAY